MVQRAAQQQMQIELAAQAAQLAAFATAENAFGDAQRAAETGDRPADGGNFYVSGRVADEVHGALAELPLHGNPAVVRGNARALKFDGVELALFEEALEAAARIRAIFADDAERAALARFGNQPVEIRRVVRDEPDARGIGRHVFRQRHDRLHERNGFERRPSGRARDAAGGSVTSDNGVGANFLAAAVFGALGLDDETAAIRMQAAKAAAELDFRASLLRLRRESLDQSAALDDEVGIVERDGGGAAVGEKLEAANFVEDAALGGAAQERAHPVRNYQRARLGLEGFDALEHADGKSSPCQQ